jgi:hypothetical protein
MSRKPKPQSSSPSGGEPDKDSTIIWGTKLEQEDFIKVPRALLMLGRYGDEKAKVLEPRHILLLLLLAGRKYKDKPIRAYWEELAEDLGRGPSTVRKWAYQLRDSGLLKLRQHRGKDPETNRPGIRNERNSFDFSPFLAILETAYDARSRVREARRERRDGGNRDE